MSHAVSADTPVPGTTIAAQTAMQKKSDSSTGAFFVGMGILLSRVLGMIRQGVFAYFFGNSKVAGAFQAALRIPNFLQNLFGEGVLSGSFIPVYAQLLGRQEQEEADRVAGAVFGLMSLAMAVLVAFGVFATPLFIDLIVPGFKGESRELAIRLVRILFPGTGLLVMSAWCLGILNSHRRFFLSYAAPVAWNLTMIGTLLLFGRRSLESELALYLAYGAVIGSLLQFAVQLPTVMSLLGKFRPSLATAQASVRQVLRSFGPVVVGRGVVQISAYVDTAYASLISEEAVSALTYAQTLYLIPVSLFGMAVSAAELPEMSRLVGSVDEVHQKLRDRINRAANRIAFFVIPSACAFLLLGDVVSAALFQRGKFHGADSRYLWYLLMGSTVGLLASTLGRLYSSAFYALKDTRTPLKYATLRVVLTAALAYWSAVRLPDQLGIPHALGAVGITATTGVAAWIEFLLLRRKLNQTIGSSGISLRRVLILWGSALAAGAVGLGLKAALTWWRGPSNGLATQWHGDFLPAPALNAIVTAALVLLPFGLSYFGLTAMFGVSEARALINRALRRRG